MKSKNIITIKSLKNEESAVINKISSLKLKRFIIPTNIKIKKSNGVITGYDLVLPKEESDLYSNMNKNKVVEELKLIREDLQSLSEHGMQFDKFDVNSVKVTSNNIYMYGYNKIFVSYDKSFVYQSNDIKMNELFGLYLIAKENPDISRMNVIDRFYGDFLETSNKYIEDFIDKEVNEENIRLYLKKK